MRRVIVFGGSRGLGCSIVSRLVSFGHDVLSVSRKSTNQLLSPNNYAHFSLDLSSLVSDELSKLYSTFPDPDAICFAHRYRPSTSPDPSKEYREMIVSVSEIIEFFDRHRTSGSKLRIVIIGSIYSDNVGFDQGWSYHCVKHAQLALVRYWSIARKGNLLFYLVSPPTYVKEGSESYWASSKKSEIWSHYPSNRLIAVSEVSELVCDVLLNGSPLLSGSNLIADMGVSKLYNDQRL